MSEKNIVVMNEEALRVKREIEKKYEAKWGEIQECCNLYKRYCRCEKQETRQEPAPVTTE